MESLWLILRIVGIVLLTAGSGWFSGAATVGLIIVIVFGAALVLSIALGMFAVKKILQFERKEDHTQF